MAMCWARHELNKAVVREQVVEFLGVGDVSVEMNVDVAQYDEIP